MARVLGGCGDTGWDSATFFRKPVDVVGRNSGYTYSDLQESRQARPFSDSDLVDASGSCPAAAAPPAAAGGPAGGPGAPRTYTAALRGGVGLGMTECEVVTRAGPPNSVQLGRNPNGDRTAILSYQSGPRPGVYHFERGRLMQMDRVEVAPPPPPKKPAKTKKRPAANHAAQSMIRKMPALGLDPRVDTGFPKRSCSIKNARAQIASIRSDCALAASQDLRSLDPADQ